jgi:hypothetical protein
MRLDLKSADISSGLANAILAGRVRRGRWKTAAIADDPLQAVLLQITKRARWHARDEPFPDSCRAPEGQRSSDTPHDREQHIPEASAPTSQDMAFEARVDEAISPAEEPHTPVTDVSPREQSILPEATAAREAEFAEWAGRSKRPRRARKRRQPGRSGPAR